MVQSAAKSTKEAEKYYKKGQASLKTGLFQWSPNYNEGLMHYEKAAKLFKEGSHDARAIDAHLQAADCAEKGNECLLCAENLASAAQLSDDCQQQISLLQKANALFKVEGQLVRGTQLMKSVAQCQANMGDKDGLKNALNIYKWLIDNELFKGDGTNLAMNNDIVPAYRKLLLVSGDFVGGI